jgi:hypothetical protein
MSPKTATAAVQYLAQGVVEVAERYGGDHGAHEARRRAYSTDSAVWHFEAEGVQAFAALGLEALPRRWEQLVVHAQLFKPAHHARENAALVLLRDPRSTDVVEGETALDSEIEPVLPALSDPIVEELGTEEADEHLLDQKIISHGSDCRELQTTHEAARFGATFLANRHTVQTDGRVDTEFCGNRREPASVVTHPALDDERLLLLRGKLPENL